MSTTGAPTLRAFPSEGCVCMRSPGAAFTSMITAPFSRKGTEMSVESTSIPAMSSPTIPAAISQAATLSQTTGGVISLYKSLMQQTASTSVVFSLSKDSSALTYPGSLTAKA